MWLSPHFHLSEFTRSQEAARYGLDNYPPQSAIESLTDLCEFVLEPIRDHFGPVNVSSGYRSNDVNQAVGGSRNSQHLTGLAADIEIVGVDNCALAKWIEDYLNFDQLILEFHNHEQGPNSGWVHVSFNKGKNRQQTLTAKRINGRTQYFSGLVK